MFDKTKNIFSGEFPAGINYCESTCRLFAWKFPEDSKNPGKSVGNKQIVSSVTYFRDSI
jgi:hypothetical protein